jgi:DNA-binding NarL/FixJ family response regulator
MRKQLIDVAIADDHNLMCEGLKRVINDTPGLRVVLQASNGEDLLQKLGRTEKLPDVLLLDISMPVMNGYEAMAVISKEYPGIRVLAISMFESEFCVIQMFRLGARGYLEKVHGAGKLIHALQIVYEGNYYYPEEFSGRTIYRIQQGVSPTGITEKELEFLSWCCSELTYKQIAAKMNLSPRTIDGYRDALFEKLDIKTRTGLVIFALRSGIAVRN